MTDAAGCPDTWCLPLEGGRRGFCFCLSLALSLSPVSSRSSHEGSGVFPRLVCSHGHFARPLVASLDPPLVSFLLSLSFSVCVCLSVSVLLPVNEALLCRVVLHAHGFQRWQLLAGPFFSWLARSFGGRWAVTRLIPDARSAFLSSFPLLSFPSTCCYCCWEWCGNNVSRNAVFFPPRDFLLGRFWKMQC